jgi:alkaline phosphatase
VRGGKARSVILLIGDGMGDSEIAIARNYQVGAGGRLAMDTLPMTGAHTTYAVRKDDPALPDYVIDSAASGTGWATGHKTYNGVVSVLPDGRAVPTVLELAKAGGYRTGDVTTAEL